jgi:hypothetical protein
MTTFRVVAETVRLRLERGERLNVGHRSCAAIGAARREGNLD